MKIGIYDPYFDSFGGGERYMLTAARHWAKNHDVTVFWDDDSMLSASSKRFSLDLSQVRRVPNVFKSGTFLQKLLTSASYDLIFAVSDGSVPMTLARHNILNFQIPFPRVNMPPWKRMRYQAVVCYSEFAKVHLDPAIGIPVSIIYPPVDTDKFKSGKKEKIILSVGRFSGLYGAKKHDILIAVFKKAIQEHILTGWKLIIAGGLLDTDRKYFATLQKMAKGYPVEFYPGCPFEKLKNLYSIASVYWHAAGYKETDPENLEHFGITTVEAMASGCIPVVFAGGGQPEIIGKNGTNGFLWNTTGELLDTTVRVIKDEILARTVRDNAGKRSRDFSDARFCASFDSLLSSVCKKS